jgi:hypothetical protein
MVRTVKLELVIDLAEFLLDSERIILSFIKNDVFYLSWKLFQKFFSQQLSFTDCPLLAVGKKCEESSKIVYIASYDRNLIQNMIPIPELVQNHTHVERVIKVK